MTVTLLPFSANHTVMNLPQNPDQVKVALKLKVPYKAMWMLILAMDLLIFQCFQDFLKYSTWFCSLYSLAYFIFLPNILLVYLITIIFKITITTKINMFRGKPISRPIAEMPITISFRAFQRKWGLWINSVSRLNGIVLWPGMIKWILN